MSDETNTRIRNTKWYGKTKIDGALQDSFMKEGKG